MVQFIFYFVVDAYLNANFLLPHSEAGPALIDHTFNPTIFCRFQPDIGECGDYVPM